MKTSSKLLIGLGVAAAVGVAATVVLSETLIDYVEHKKKRSKIRHFVDDKLDGNEKVMDIVTKLDDDEVDTIFSLVDKAKAGRNYVTVAGGNVKEATEKAKDALKGFIDQIG